MCIIVYCCFNPGPCIELKKGVPLLEFTGFAKGLQKILTAPIGSEDILPIYNNGWWTQRLCSLCDFYVEIRAISTNFIGFWHDESFARCRFFVMARQKWSTNLQEQIEQLCWPKGRRAGARSKKRSLQVVCHYVAPHFENIFNAAMAKKMLRAKLS